MAVPAFPSEHRPDAGEPTPHWHRAFETASLPPGAARVLRAGGEQLAVFRDEEGAVFAVENRCPHEGYPLAQGHRRGHLLLCAWHNFCFDLRSGRCVAGDEGVRAYATREVDGFVEVDLAAPDPAALASRHLASLEEALLQRRLGQAARDTLRLLQAGVSPLDLVRFGARFDAERAEFGSTHALAVAADVLPLLARFSGTDALVPLMQIFELASDPSVRRPRRPECEPVDPGADPDAAFDRLQRAVEGFAFRESEGLLRGALARGWGRDVLEPWLYRLCTAHFAAFGHPLIYQTKLFELIDALGWGCAAELLPAFLLHVGVAARDDRIPTFAAFRQRLEALEPSLERWFGAAASRELALEERAGLQRLLLEGREDDAFDALARALDAGVAPDALARALVVAAAERLLRFDASLETDPEIQEGWLDVTHLLTYASAVRCALARHREPNALRLLFYAAHFIHRMGPLDLPAAARPPLPPAPCEVSPPAREDVLEAVAERRAGDAVRRCAQYLACDGDPDALREGLEDRILADHAVRPIFVAHQIKLTAAAFREARALRGDPRRHRPVLAAVRFLASPLAERRLAQACADARRFVIEKKTPRRLTS